MKRLDKIKGAIIDLDGTILDSMWVWAEVDRRFLSVRGHDVPDDYMHAINHMTMTEVAEYTINRFSLKDTKEELIAEWVMLAKDAYGSEVELKPNVLLYLQKLTDSGIKLAIATALSDELTALVLTSNCITNYFDNITNVSEVLCGKSQPDVYIKAAEKMNLLPSECAVFEDILVGILSAKKAGFLTVAVHDKTSDISKAEIKKNADIFIENFSELI